ncbi:MAG: hypothetical protein V1899_05135 [Planctomycetota bacterium]
MRYVILHHTDWTEQPDHYDLMLQLEEGGDDDDLALKTFSTLSNEFPTGASHQPLATSHQQPINLLRLISNHRRAYLTFQGSISRNRGQVKRVDEGVLTRFEQSSVGGELRAQFSGHRLNGQFELKPLGQNIFYFEQKGEQSK